MKTSFPSRYWGATCPYVLPASMEMFGLSIAEVEGAQVITGRVEGIGFATKERGWGDDVPEPTVKMAASYFPNHTGDS